MKGYLGIRSKGLLFPELTSENPADPVTRLWLKMVELWFSSGPNKARYWSRGRSSGSTGVLRP